MLRFFKILAFCCLCIVASASSVQDVAFKHITTDDGLSQISVNTLYIDENGIVWIGTRNGLNRFNGNNIQTFKLNKNDPNSLFCNTVLAVVGDGNGMIYLLCTEGIAELNLSTEHFTTLLQGDVNSIYYYDGLFIGRDNEIYEYDRENKNFRLYRKIADETIEICCMCRQGDCLWVGTNSKGVYKMDILTDSVSHPIKTGNITSIYKDDEGELWIGSWDEGLYHVFQDGHIENLRHDKNNVKSLSSNFVRTCCEDNNGNMWIGTFNGLNKLTKNTRRIQYYPAESNNSEGLTHSSVWCIVKDTQGTLWLGTYFGGVNYFNPEFEIYKRYTVSDEGEKGLSSSIVGRTIEDADGNLWIGTEGGGLDYYNRNTHEFKWYRYGVGPNNISHNNVKALYYDKKDKILWIGTHTGGLNRLDVQTGAIRHYRMHAGDVHSLPSDIIRDIVPYKKDVLIVGTQNGVCLFRKVDGKCEQLFKDSPDGLKIKMVTKVLLDNEGKLWVAATGEGVFRYDFEDKSLTDFRHDVSDSSSLSNNNVNNIMQDSKGNLWFATSGSGLDKFVPESNSFVNYDHEYNGLISDCIYDVQESPVSGRLLLATNLGLAIFDTAANVFKNYSVENGFPMTDVNENALCVTHDGEIFLGGMKGMISFHENALNFPPKPYKIILSNLYVNGKEVSVGDQTGILNQSLCYTKEITLHHAQSIFSIEYSTSNYIAENKDDILYKLEGFSNEWQSARGQYGITYTNLNPGTYHLVLKAAGKDTSLCRPASLTIHILPPFYRTPIAYLIYLLLICSLVWYLVKTNNTRIKLRESLKYEQQHIKDVEALNQSKLRFFTNISHEFRTPLTLIVAQVETLIQAQNYTPALYNKLLSIYHCSIELRDLITELLDFRKQEQGHMKVRVRPHNIVSFLYENYLLFKDYSDHRRINMEFEKDSDDIEVWYDQKQMQKVINNLLSNASKHSDEGGTITLGIKADGTNAIIRVTDTGCGIDVKEIDKIFDRFYQVEGVDEIDSKAGIGIGLALTKGIVELHHGKIAVESELGKGSSFIVSLPLGKECFSTEEIDNRTEQEMQSELLQPDVGEHLKSELEENSPNKNIPNVKILIVEDNMPIRNILVDIFRPYYNVIVASNGKDGLEMVRSEMPNIVVSDIVMPEMSGIELCKQIKSDFNCCHIPVVLLTARGCLEQNIEGFLIGADDYITKPFNINLLISRCNNLVNSRRLLQEKFSRQPKAYVQMLATNPIDKQFLDKATKIIEQHLDDTEFNVGVFSQEMAIARTKLFTKLKAVTGQTPNDFILSIRLKKGALMLRNNPELNITEISDRIGFSSSRYFSKCFKDVYHVSPLAYRKGEEEKS
ncbi:MAG: ATP-binding protein [Bacteroidales bacterium]|jgi:signal transduction histidine kinase/ligand-binding sensor domain-containing protein/DNA-binding response OmpR family regulator|nr:ATP-binding protein [Bacteroidales bacterium]MCI2145174.1 ATP-binding protein [Bacteroidales bacterium]